MRSLRGFILRGEVLVPCFRTDRVCVDSECGFSLCDVSCLLLFLGLYLCPKVSKRTLRGQLNEEFRRPMHGTQFESCTVRTKGMGQSRTQRCPTTSAWASRKANFSPAILLWCVRSGVGLTKMQGQPGRFSSRMRFHLSRTASPLFPMTSPSVAMHALLSSE